MFYITFISTLCFISIFAAAWVLSVVMLINYVCLGCSQIFVNTTKLLTYVIQVDKIYVKPGFNRHLLVKITVQRQENVDIFQSIRFVDRVIFFVALIPFSVIMPHITYIFILTNKLSTYI